MINHANDFELMSALESMSTWAHHNGCSTSPPVETTGIGYSTNVEPNGEAIFYDYQGCPDDIIVEHYAIIGASNEIKEAEQDLTGLDDEGLTWRLQQAALSKGKAARAIEEEATASGEDASAMSKHLQNLLDDQIWVKKKR